MVQCPGYYCSPKDGVKAWRSDGERPEAGHRGCDDVRSLQGSDHTLTSVAPSEPYPALLLENLELNQTR